MGFDLVKLVLFAQLLIVSLIYFVYFSSVTSLNESQNKIHNLSCQVENLREMLDMKV